MKKFFLKTFMAISFLCFPSHYANACLDPITHNYYLFSVYNQLSPRNYNVECNRKWEEYSHGQVKGFNSKKLLLIAKEKGDKAMLNYIKDLSLYLEICNKIKDTWNYPSKQELSLRNQTIQNIAKRAKNRLTGRLKAQNALLLMRCNMLLEHHAANLKLWQNSFNKLPNSAYKEMMKNIYGGALAKSNQKEKAFELFAEMGDLESIKWIYYGFGTGETSLQNILSLYQRNPNSKALPYLVQDYVNDAQETLDIASSPYIGRKIRDDYKKEVLAFINFAKKAAKNKNIKTPVLWQSAAAWLEFMFANHNTALKDIEEALLMPGTNRMKDNAKALAFYIKAANEEPSESYDQFVLNQIKWLIGKEKEEQALYNNYANTHYINVLDRVTYQLLVPKYKRARQPFTAALLTGMVGSKNAKYYDDMVNNIDDSWNPNYSSDYFNQLDSMSGNQLIEFIKFVGSPTNSALNSWLLKHANVGKEYLYDITGTKLLAEGKFAEAKKYLQQVSMEFLHKQNIWPYMSTCSFTIAPWFKRQHGIYDDENNILSKNVGYNPKLEFINYVTKLQGALNIANYQHQGEIAYELAVALFQASYMGDCWFLTHYGWSVYDKYRKGDFDYVGKAIEYLTNAKKHGNANLLAKTLYAAAFIPQGPWYAEEWSNAESIYKKVIYPNNRQYKALEELYVFSQTPESENFPYISHCDVLKQFAATKK